MAFVPHSEEANRGVNDGDRFGGGLTILVRSSEADLCETGKSNLIVLVVLQRTEQLPVSRIEGMTSFSQKDS